MQIWSLPFYKGNMYLVLHCELVSPELVTIQQPSIVEPSNMNVLNGSCKHCIHSECEV